MSSTTTTTGARLTYTGQKMRRVKWLPRESGDLTESSIFVTGSYDDKVNSVTMWNYKRQPESDTVMGVASMEPHPLHTHNVPDSVTDIQFIDNDTLAVCLSDGSIMVLKYWTSEGTLESLFTMDSLHSSPQGGVASCSCAAVSQFSPGTVFTGGEDGKICVVSTEQGSIRRRVGEDETTSVNAITCISHSEILAGCNSSQLKLWDLREDCLRPAKTIVLSKEITSAQSLDRHPNQPHLTVTGCGNGCVCFWDLRQDKKPINILEAHQSEVWEARFHPLYPNYLFSCSQDGSLWQWNSALSSAGTGGFTDTIFNSSVAMATSGNVSMETGHHDNWLSSSLDVCSILPGGDNISINSFDICYKDLIAVTDHESLHIIPNLLI